VSRTRWLLAVGLVLAAATPATALEPLRCPAVVFLYDDAELVSQKQTDTNGDCKADEFVFYENGVAVRGETDRNHDGHVDAWAEFASDGAFIRQRFDESGDGKPDRTITFAGEYPSTREEDRNGDGRTDLLISFEAGVPTASEEDSNFDGQLDKWSWFEQGNPVRVEEDRDHDRKVDLRAEFAQNGTKLVEQQDTTSDGELDVQITYQDGVRSRVDADTDANGEVDLITHYAAGAKAGTRRRSRRPSRDHRLAPGQRNPRARRDRFRGRRHARCDPALPGWRPGARRARPRCGWPHRSRDRVRGRRDADDPARGFGRRRHLRHDDPLRAGHQGPAGGGSQRRRQRGCPVYVRAAERCQPVEGRRPRRGP